MSKARNAGLAALPPNIEFVSFLDADDIWLPDFLEVTYSKLKCDSEAVACHTLGKFIDSDGNDIRLGECEAMCRVRPTLHGSSVGPSDILEPTTLSTLIISGAIVAPSAVLFRREVIAKINGFDPKFQICADWNLYLRAAKYGRFLFVESALLGYRQHGGNMSTNQERQKEEQRRVVQAALSSIEYSDEQRLLLRRSFKAGQRYLFKQKLILSVGALKRLKVRQCVQQLAYGIKHLIRFISGTP